ncbi:EAL domain, c-di-GMP-specific phosphodiesterase class I (or its enzymatically inactive variant) [Bryocella elongata]|uniref:EAL domain, c-di-GMP-specific phosphodiesterase class I (Or its enzymatically inactive variant) n=1 Tax=Bryocella elongata TaxID=863522 RepID=A0A1H6BYJ0_9BACT|nr:EAL domain-containing protein [Bryocella elongata]SEG65527.1 EAL domain, c-di-GMP-specific phosphodiesterase class I (or its enzymatically inactive variant) [Bryocella elongata]
MTPNPSPHHADITFAYQPIVDVVDRKTVSYEALVRGRANESAFKVFQRVEAVNLHSFDASCRVAAIELACHLGLPCDLNLNLLPRSLFSSPEAILSTIQAANLNHLALDRITLEVTEGEVIDDHAHFAQLLDEYRGLGIKISIDDFGAGHSGLNLLADLQPDQLKLDMTLVRNIASLGPRQSIVRAILGVCHDLGIDMIAEGVETLDEYAWFAEHGVRLFQGYLFAQPGFECLPQPSIPNPNPLLA